MRIYRLFSLFAVTLALLIASIGLPEIASAQKKAKWSYEGKTGPENWASLSSDYKACDGSQQSPINLTNASSAKKPTIKTEYESAKAKVTDTGHAIKVNTKGGTLTVGGTTYNLLQFHVHTPSEHTVEGKHYPGEIHLVHQAGKNKLAVLAVFLKEGESSNPALQNWIKGKEMKTTYDASDLLPSKRSYYTYEGSLTTPPCSEIVRWVVMETPIQASSAQLDTLRSHYEGNNRPVQPLNDRTIRYVSSK